MTRSTIVGLLVGLLVVACRKDVPLATTDAMPATTDATTDTPMATIDAPEPACSNPHQDGDPCSVEGQECVWSASCGEDTALCLLGSWRVSLCDASIKHCPCMSSSDCDPLSQCAADGVCEPLLTMSGCGGAGQSCCGGACGSCGVGLSCAGGTCEPPMGGGTLGAACTLQCDGTSNCDPHQYCPDSCATCPCSDTCHAQASICTVGNDQTCDPGMTALYAHCVAAQGPFATKCECLPGSTDPATGTCM
jgi:hypothetical protein